MLNFSNELDSAVINAVENNKQGDNILGVIANRFAQTIVALEEQDKVNYYQLIMVYLDDIYRKKKSNDTSN